MLLSTSMFMVMNWTDTLMIGYYLEESEVGIYRLAFKVAALITFAQFAINSIAAPMFSSFKAKGDMKGLKRITRNIGYLNILISGPVFALILLFPGYVLEFFGEEFIGGVEPLIILAVGSIINALCGPVMYLLNMTGKEKPARNIIIIASLLNVILNLYLIPEHGLLGAAYATSISTVVWNALAVVQIKKEYGFISIPHPFSK
jgi:O-antigen/teichoic acid export membrane protein